MDKSEKKDGVLSKLEDFENLHRICQLYFPPRIHMGFTRLGNFFGFGQQQVFQRVPIIFFLVSL